MSLASSALADRRRTIVLVDGEHHPPVVRAAIAELDARVTVVAAVLLKGGEKLTTVSADDYGVSDLVEAATPLEGLLKAIEQHSPHTVFDMSDEPVLDARERLLLAAHALRQGVGYEGAGFSFQPPPRPRLTAKPTIAVIGTGKRTGKTALAAALARELVASGRPPVLVTMGRGGPSQPELIDPRDDDLSPRALLALADQGRHAASDHFEDAITAGVVTVGTRRCGGGLAGEPASSTLADGVRCADGRPEPFLVFEGSGTAIPPAHADATVCVVPGDADTEIVTGYLGPYALLLADLVVITMTSPPPDEDHERARPSSSDSERGLEALEDRIRRLVPGISILRTVLRPWPLASIAQRSVVLATTGSETAAAWAAAQLETRHHANVIGWTNQLADRSRLAADLGAMPAAEVLVTELKAAAVDVATRMALGRGMEVVYCDNRPEPVTGEGRELARALRQVADLAASRAGARG